MRFKYTDYHVHSRWSQDIAKFGPIPEQYIWIAERNKINICFLEHYELVDVETNRKCPFYGGRIVDYLEEMDEIKSNYDFILSGLEVEYYDERKKKLMEFMDDYEKQFDFIAGSLHETDVGYPVTTREKLIKLLRKKRVKDIVDRFFELSKNMIKSGIFKNICHPDTIWRYINPRDIKPSFDIDVSEKRVLELGRACIEHDVRMEYNLSGYFYPINRPFPSKSVIKQLRKEGCKFFVGSDSHSTNYFKANVKKVKKAYKYLNRIKSGSKSNNV